jgi:hypothetical protein
VQNTNLFRVRWLKNGSFDFAEGLASCVGAKANVPFVGWQLNFKIFVRWVKKLKHIWVGNECRDICLSVSFFIPSLIFNFHCQFAVSLSFFRLCITVCSYKKLAISKHKTVNLHESLIEKLNFN